jgi:hypothetical protein
VTGFVQQVKYDPMLEAALVWVGLTSADTVLCYVRVTANNEPAALVKLGMIEGLTAAMLGGRSVTLSTDDANPSSIESVAIHPVLLGEEAPA